MISIQDLKVGQVVQIGVGFPLYIVLEQADAYTVFLTDTLEVIVETSGYAIVKGENSVEIVQNENSGVSHLTVNGKPICGQRNGQNQVTVDVVTCEKCKGLYVKGH